MRRVPVIKLDRCLHTLYIFTFYNSCKQIAVARSENKTNDWALNPAVPSWFQRTMWRALAAYTWCIYLAVRPVGSLEWSSVPASGTLPSARRDMAMGYFQTQNKLVVFGGKGGPITNDTWVFDFVAGENYWSMFDAGKHSKIYVCWNPLIIKNFYKISENNW